ncbi:bacterial lipocalin [Lentimicrobium saccharophilum]|uniref:Bacterial lipocalin n=1 Tax=Lentimicrobium saccharophilum TaxID=1678841 RepID=A0A0S7BZQ3_9BACT|nr:lipocalin family protein [Lentimicrobium saccharophilum]GAP42304.1 bacterial lipocalin [Lentimicrobium saccharophilum]
MIKFTSEMNISMKFSAMITLAGIFLLGCRAQDRTPTAVGSVDLEKYAGLWYDIASFPQRFQKGCHCTVAEYGLNADGTVSVTNRCRKGGYQEKESSVTGKAFIVKGSNNTKLRVQFFWPFRGDYWIVMLEPGYRWAVVSSPKKDYLWILSRTPSMDENEYNAIVNKLATEGYDTGKLVRTLQECQ